MGATMSGHWDLGDTGTSRDYDALVRSLGWQCECTAHTLPGAVPVAGAVRPDSPAKPTSQKTSHSRQSDMLGCQHGCTH